jgi:F0F1-type ATP synthase epsilon subunit
VAKFRLRIVNAKSSLFEGDVSSVFVKGDKSEFEILPFHYPIISVVLEGKIIVDGDKYININKGILKCSENDCLILTD